MIMERDIVKHGFKLYICGYCFSISNKSQKKTKKTNSPKHTHTHKTLMSIELNVKNYSCYGYFNYKYKTIFSKQKLLQFT